jgi:hypothetical protein
MAFFSRAEKPSEDINSRLFLMNMKGLSKFVLWRHLCIMKYLTTPPPLTTRIPRDRCGTVCPERNDVWAE